MSTATVEAPSARAEASTDDPLASAIKAERHAYERWQADALHGADNPPGYLLRAMEQLFEAFGATQIPRKLARVAPLVDDLRYAYVSWSRDASSGVDTTRRLWACHDAYQKERDRPLPATLPTVAQLDKEKVGHLQIARIWRLFRNGNQKWPDVGAVSRELANPGSVITPEHIARVEEERLGLPQRAAARVERIESPVPAPTQRTPQSIEELVITRVPRNQIIDIKLRDWPKAERGMIERMIDDTCAALGVSIPGSAHGAMAEVGESYIKAGLGMEEGDRLLNPLEGMKAPSLIPAAPSPTKQVVEVAAGPSSDLAERCHELFEQGMSYADIADHLGPDLGNLSNPSKRANNPSKRAKKVERLVNQYSAGASDSEPGEGEL